MAGGRKGLSKRQRFEVFKRDGFTCQYCGRKPPAVILEADHMIPVADGGEDHEGNMITACQDCNRGKADKPLDQVPQPIADQVRDKVDRAAQVAALNSHLLALREQEIAIVEGLGAYWWKKTHPGSRRSMLFGDAREASIRTFLKDLPASEIYDAVDIALGRIRTYGDRDDKAWKYFCGICWKKIREGF